MKTISKFTFFFAALVIAFFTTSGHCQTGTISGQAIDQTGQVFALGTYRIDYQPPAGTATGNPTRKDTGVKLAPSDLTKTGNLNSTGNFSVAGMIRTDYINPSGGTWKVSVCPNASPSNCSYVFVTLTSGATIATTALTAAIGSLSVDISQTRITATAYKDSEITGQSQGSFYWNVTDGTLRAWNGTTWVAYVNTSGNNNFVGGISAPNLNSQFQTFASNMAKDNQDRWLNILSDSTAYTYGYNVYPAFTTGRWPIYYAQALAAKYPTYTVKFRQWLYDVGTSTPGAAYDVWVTIQTGSGANTLWISNASFPGATTIDFINGRFLTAFDHQPDLVIVSMMHNFTPTCPNCWANLEWNATEMINQAFENPPMVLLSENVTMAPYLYVTQTPQKADMIQKIAQDRGYGFVNMYQQFVDGAALYTLPCLVRTLDGLHPTSPDNVPLGCVIDGSQYWSNQLMTYMTYGESNPTTAQRTSTLNESDEQLLLNGTFENFPADQTIPISWTLSGTGTVTKNSTAGQYSNGVGYSLKIQCSGGASCALQQNLVSILPKLQGRCATLTIHRYVDAGQPTTVGRISLSDSVGGVDSDTFSGNVIWGAMGYDSVTHCFPTNAGSPLATIYGDASTTNGAASFDWVSLTLGDYPKNQAKIAIQQFTNIPSFTADGNIGNITAAFKMQNTTPATVGVPKQQSNGPFWVSRVWDTGTVASKYSMFTAFDNPTSANPATHCLSIRGYIGASSAPSWTEHMRICDTGAIVATSFAGSVAPTSAGNSSVGTVTIPYSSVFIGAAGNQTGQLTGTFTGNRIFTFPDVISDTVILANAAQTLTAKTIGTSLSMNGKLLLTASAPTISSGFGTTPSITGGNGSEVFEVNVGTGGVATSGVVAMTTAATTAWTCMCNDITTTSATVFQCKQTASSTSAVTIGNFNTTGAAAAWVASDKIRMMCKAY